MSRAIAYALGALTGVVIALALGDAQLGDLTAERDTAQRRQRAAERLVDAYAATCGPRLSWPIGSTPEIIPAAQEGPRP